MNKIPSLYKTIFLNPNVVIDIGVDTHLRQNVGFYVESGKFNVCLKHNEICVTQGDFIFSDFVDVDKRTAMIQRSGFVETHKESWNEIANGVNIVSLEHNSIMTCLFYNTKNNIKEKLSVINTYPIYTKDEIEVDENAYIMLVEGSIIINDRIIEQNTWKLLSKNDYIESYLGNKNKFIFSSKKQTLMIENLNSSKSVIAVLK